MSSYGTFPVALIDLSRVYVALMPGASAGPARVVALHEQQDTGTAAHHYEVETRDGLVAHHFVGPTLASLPDENLRGELARARELATLATELTARIEAALAARVAPPPAPKPLSLVPPPSPPSPPSTPSMRPPGLDMPDLFDAPPVAPVEVPKGRVALHIAAADAVARQLPAVNVTILGDELPLHCAPFPEPGVFVRASGPPGGPLGLVLRASAPGAPLVSVVADRSSRPVEPAPESSLDFGGTRFRAQVIVAGESLATATWLAVEIPWSPTESLYLGVFSGGRCPPGATPDAVAEWPNHAALLRSVRVNP